MSTPQTPHPSHLDVELLADLQEGLLEPGQVAAADEHLAGCAECRAQSQALDDLRAALRAGGVDADVAAPEDVVRRLDDALAAATAPLGTASATVTPLTARTARRRQPWKTRVLQAAAVFVLVAAVGALGYGGIRGLGGGGGATSADSAASGGGKASTENRATARKFSVMSSDRNYTTSSLRTAVPGLLSEAAQYSADTGADAPSPATSVPPNSPTPAAGSLADPNRLRNGIALAQCVANLATAIQGLPKGPVTPLAVDIARFEGKPATIILLPDPDPSFVNAYAVEPACPKGTFLAWEHVALP